MKKFLTVLMAAVMVLSMSIAAFAAADDFLVSPSKKPAPELVDDEHLGGDGTCDGDLEIIPYGERDKLDDDDKDFFEDAYDSIVNAGDLSDLNDKLDDDLAVGDLFGVKNNGCTEHDHKSTLDIDNADKFEHIIAFDGEKWIIVDAIRDGDKITFTYKFGDFSVFAIVYSTDGAPQTGDTFSWGYVVLMVASATGFVAVCISMRKKKN